MKTKRVHKFEEERDSPEDGGWWFGWLLCHDPETDHKGKFESTTDVDKVTCLRCLSKLERYFEQERK